MHELILEFVRAAPQPLALLRVPLDDGALVAAFETKSSPEAAAPRWIAKFASGAHACARLRSESAALSALEPWSSRLGLARQLAWREAEAGEPACLLQSGVPGFARPWRWRGGNSALPRGLDQAIAWLQHFQACRFSWLPWPALTLGQLAEQALADRARHIAAHPEWASMLGAIPEVLLAPPGISHEPAVPVHGDFWSGNLLFSGRSRSPAIAVIDWSGFAPGTRWHDLLTLLANLRCGTMRRSLGRAQAWEAVFYATGRARDMLLRWAGLSGASGATVGWAFHLFAQQRMAWELGLGLQTRNPAERAQAMQEWGEIVAAMAQRGFPSPLA
ncbi:MAG TPA: phosphotransferase [Terriglobales bacterium]|nr:phosphotransferase [Terriglobales bacterium]